MKLNSEDSDVKTEFEVDDDMYANEIAQANEATGLASAGITGPTSFDNSSDNQGSSDGEFFTANKGASPFNPFTSSTKANKPLFSRQTLEKQAKGTKDNRPQE
jgi:hypothetical protein